MAHDLPVLRSVAGLPPGPPRHSMQRKLVWWTVAIVAISTFVCALWLTRIARHAMARSHGRSVAILNQTLAAALAGRLTDGWNPAANQVLNVLALDPRLAFFIVTDAKDQPLHRRVIDSEAWAAYLSRVEPVKPPRVIEVDRALVLGSYGDLIIHKTPIWNPPTPAVVRRRAAGERRRSLEGFVILAVREPALPQTLSKLRLMQLVAVCVVSLLSVPVVMWMVRCWTAPVRSLLEATARLSVGDRPSPVSIKTQDEMGLLAASFNRMAENLSTARAQLQSANQQLEQKVQDRTAELEKAVRKLEEMAATDPLTGLSNRRSFGQALARRFAEAQREGDDLACVMIDVDHFKLINDSLGHRAGDDLLQHTARLLVDQCRHSDVAGRFGGDEFVILLPRTSPSTARQVVERVSKEFVSCVRRLLGQWAKVDQIRLSVGVATLSGSGATDPEHLMARADQALYRAKQTGRAKLVVLSNDRLAATDPLAP